MLWSRCRKTGGCRILVVWCPYGTYSLYTCIHKPRSQQHKATCLQPPPPPPLDPKNFFFFFFLGGGGGWGFGSLDPKTFFVREGGENLMQVSQMWPGRKQLQQIVLSSYTSAIQFKGQCSSAFYLFVNESVWPKLFGLTLFTPFPQPNPYWGWVWIFGSQDLFCQRGWWCIMDTPTGPTPCLENWPKNIGEGKKKGTELMNQPQLFQRNCHLVLQSPPPPPLPSGL